MLTTQQPPDGEKAPLGKSGSVHLFFFFLFWPCCWNCFKKRKCHSKDLPGLGCIWQKRLGFPSSALLFQASSNFHFTRRDCWHTTCLSTRLPRAGGPGLIDGHGTINLESRERKLRLGKKNTWARGKGEVNPLLKGVLEESNPTEWVLAVASLRWLGLVCRLCPKEHGGERRSFQGVLG